MSFNKKFTALCTALVKLCLLLGLLPLAAFSGPYVNDATLRDIRIYIRFEDGSGYIYDPQAQEDLIKGTEMAMRMWESILPAMRVTFVYEPAQANLVFSVGNYAGVDIPGCGIGGGVPGGTWSGCSFHPDENGNFTKNTIYLNTMGSIRYHHDRFTFFSRDALYSSYVPATEPPDGYGNMDLANGMGYLDGRFRSELGGTEVTKIVFHEFGHSVGLGHSIDDMSKFYGVPYPPGQRCVPTANQPCLPHKIVPDRNLYPLLPAEYYGGGTPANPWVSDLRPLGVNLGKMMENWNVPRGLPRPSIDMFNFRVVHPDDSADLASLLPKSKLLYPTTKGIIRLQNGPDGAVLLTPNWRQAIQWAQLDRSGAQSNPYFVTGVFNHGQIQRVAAGAFHTLAIRDDGTLWAWGANDRGQLGNGNTNSSATPISIGSGLLGSGRYWISVAAGEKFSLALRSDLALFVWGDRAAGQVGDGVFSSTPQTTPKQVSGQWAAAKAAAMHVVALKSNGTLWAWGNNGMGQLGNGNNQNQASPSQEFGQATDWVSVSPGSNHSTGMKADGSLWTWGWNEFGTLGNFSNTNSNRPVREAYWAVNWALSKAGHEHSLGLNEFGDAFTWGRNEYNQLGTASQQGSENYPIYLGGTWSTLAAGYWHSAGIKLDGSLWSWGWNSKGQLGGNLAAGSTRRDPVQERTLSRNWLDIYLGREQTLAFRTDGSLWGWGNNSQGQLGTGSTSGSPVLSPVPSLFGNVPTISLGGKYTDITGEVKSQTAPGGLSGGRQNNDQGNLIGSTLNLTAVAEGNISKVEFFNGSTLLKTATAAPYTLDWLAPAAGRYSLTARATGRMNAVKTSPVLTLDLYEMRHKFITPPTTSVNLSSEGALDWMHWGRTGTGRIEKANTSLISLGAWFPSQVSRFSSASTSVPGFTWTGSNQSSPNETNANLTRTGLLTQEISGIFSFTLPATTTARTVQLWFRVRNASAEISAMLDSQTPIHVNREFSNYTTATKYMVYSLTFANSSGNSTLYLQLRNLFPPSPRDGDVAIQAISLK